MWLIWIATFKTKDFKMKIEVVEGIKYYFPETMEEFLSIKKSEKERIGITTELQKDICLRIRWIERKVKK